MRPPLLKLEQELQATLAGLSVDQTQATPLAHPEKWTIQQVAEHLRQTYRSTTPQLLDRVQKGSVTRAQPSLRQRIGQFVVIALGRFPNGRRAPESVSPGPSALRTGDDLARELHAELAHLDAAANQAEALFGGRRRCASHMVLGPLSVNQWCRFHLIHGRHHLRQIRAIRREHAF